MCVYAPASVRVGGERLLALLDCVSFHHLQPAAAALAECAEADVPAAHVAGVRVTIWLVFPQFQISNFSAYLSAHMFPTRACCSPEHPRN